MQLVTRAEWGAKASRYPLDVIPGTEGTKIHYEGTWVDPALAHADRHGDCAGHVRAIQQAHLDNPSENWSDIAYNYVICPHGSVFEGRGLHRRTGANGNQALNRAHYSVCALLGSKGLTEPTTAQLAGLRDAVDYLRTKGGAGDEIKGHRDGYATDCPGGPLYAWVKKGAPRPGGGSTPPPPPHAPAAPPFPGWHFFIFGAHNAYAKQLQTWLEAGHWGPAYTVGPSETMTHKDLQKVAALQAHYLADLGPADGLTGPRTWRYAYEVAHGLRHR